MHCDGWHCDEPLPFRLCLTQGASTQLHCHGAFASLIVFNPRGKHKAALWWGIAWLILFSPRGKHTNTVWWAIAWLILFFHQRDIVMTLRWAIALLIVLFNTRGKPQAPFWWTIALLIVLFNPKCSEVLKLLVIVLLRQAHRHTETLWRASALCVVLFRQRRKHENKWWWSIACWLLCLTIGASTQQDCDEPLPYGLCSSNQG